MFPPPRTSQGFPIVTTAPDLTPRSGAVRTTRRDTPDFRNGQMQQFNFSLQRELGKDMVATAGLCQLGRRQAVLGTQSSICPIRDRRRGSAASVLRQLPGVTGITWLESSANSFFSSMQTTFEKRFSSGFYFLGNWTWSHSLDNFGGDGGPTSADTSRTRPQRAVPPEHAPPQAAKRQEAGRRLSRQLTFPRS